MKRESLWEGERLTLEQALELTRETIVLYGPRYRHWAYQHQERGIALAEGHLDAAHEAAALLSRGSSLILLCACKDARTCHRTLVAKLIQDALIERSIVCQ
jgi:uncharacterized protein YeaO (DUF488 family)